MKNIIEFLRINCKKAGGGFLEDFQSFSYESFWNNSRFIASNLLKFNLHKAPIAVLAPSKTHTVELFMGVVQSGNFYVPIDPSCPPLRLESMLSGIGVFLCEKCEMTQEIQYILDKNNIRVEFYENLCQPNVANFPLLDEIEKNVLPTDPLAGVFTSGSTGVAKCVVKSHGAMLSFVNTFLSEFPLSKDDVIGNQTPLYFDASSKDVFLALASGAKLLFIPKVLFSFPVKLVEFLNEHNVTTILWVPSALTIVAKLGTFKYILPKTLKRVFFVGEVFHAKYLNIWLENLPNVMFVNIYGASETAGVVCRYVVKKPLADDEVLPLGEPFKNTKIWLWDENEKTCSEGEMVIESDALATCYFADEEKTNQKFIRFKDEKGWHRAYRTGDLAKFDEDGNLVFKSRNDHQIKHMGHRIELGDIENAAYAVQDVEEACAVYDAQRQKIVLFLTMTNGVEFDAKSVKDKMAKKLPEYMLPSKIVKLDVMPKNANGKTDRQAIQNLI